MTRRLQFSVRALLRACAFFAAAAFFCTCLNTFHPYVLGLSLLGALACVGMGIGALFDNIALGLVVTIACVWGVGAVFMIVLLIAGVR